MPVAFLRFDAHAVAEQSRPWWAQRGARLVGSNEYIEYVIELRVPPGPSWMIRRRYSDFAHCHDRLVADKVADVPPLPPKEMLRQRIFASPAARSDWLHDRRRALQIYVGELILRPDLQSRSCVQELLALDLSEVWQLEPPMSCRIRRARSTGDKEVPLSSDPDSVPLEVTVRHTGQILSPSKVPSGADEKTDMLPQTDGEEHQYVRSEEMEGSIVTFFKAKLMEEPATAIAPDKHLNDEVVVRVRAALRPGTSDTSILVNVRPGQTYVVQAASVNRRGLQSAPITLTAHIPVADGPITATACIPSADGPPVRVVDHAATKETDSPTHNGGCARQAYGRARAQTDGASSVSSSFAARDRTLSVPASASAGCGSRDSGSEDGSPDGSSRRTMVSPIQPKSLRLEPVTYRGRAAAEYMRVANQKKLDAYEKTPFQLLASPRPDQSSAASTLEEEDKTPRLTDPSSTLEGRHVQVDLGSVRAADSTTSPEAERSLHRDAEELDGERLLQLEQRCLAEAREVAAWIGQTTGRRELLAKMQEPGSDLETFRQLLVSGEVLCELLNCVATRSASSGSDAEAGQLPVASYKTGRQVCHLHVQMDNVTSFLRACRDFFKVPEHQLFPTVDLCEGHNMPVVVKCLAALCRTLQQFASK
eukprot:TRINITY_DN43861_c0_g1_i1.p1 TRINITY_DN43861_c0_g1~~TRINITY_DN43861_c0_g1_i1.p1  ORF type:complete len:649 (-),score=106.78 TRINITY_DN43861_c0_g1_i1:122-2068(-)